MNILNTRHPQLCGFTLLVSDNCEKNDLHHSTCVQRGQQMRLLDLVFIFIFGLVWKVREKINSVFLFCPQRQFHFTR